MKALTGRRDHVIHGQRRQQGECRGRYVGIDIEQVLRAKRPGCVLWPNGSGQCAACLRGRNSR